MKKCLYITYHGAWPDPPQVNCIRALKNHFTDLTVVQPGYGSSVDAFRSWGVEVITRPPPHGRLRPESVLGRCAQLLRFRKAVHEFISRMCPDLVVTYMLHSLAVLPRGRREQRSTRLVSMVLDIPALEYSGLLDSVIIRAGWRRLAQADLVWASDAFKVQLAQQIGQLPTLPLVCHNCPPRDYLPEPAFARDPWLRGQLRQQGATLGESGGCVLLRAGAIGEHGGIEETLEAMRDLPLDYVFLMLGRPTEAYKQRLVSRIAALRLERRAFFWDRPNDEVWKKALQGADIGHLIHGPFPPGYMTRLYELNSSLSNNRLFQYMAAALPIIAYDDPRMNELYDEVPCFRVARIVRLKDDLLRTWRELGVDICARTQLGQAARTAQTSKYYWEKQFAPVVEAIDQLMNYGTGQGNELRNER